jgi:hypothetical protein
MTAPRGATEILTQRMKLDFVPEKLSERAKTHDWLDPVESEALRQRVRERSIDLLDAWSKIAHDYQNEGIYLQYQQYEAGAARPLLYDILDPGAEKDVAATTEIQGKPFDAGGRTECQRLAQDSGRRRIAIRPEP